MPAQSYSYLAFNRGLISRLGLSRQDIDRTRLSAQTMNNWMPRVLGSMSLRPGLQYLGQPRSGNATRLIPFVFSQGDRAMLEFTNLTMRVWIDDAVLTNPTVSSTIVNGNFASDLSGWNDADESGASSGWYLGTMDLLGTGVSAAIRWQQVTVSGADTFVEHALRIVVGAGALVGAGAGAVTLRVGTSFTDDSYIAETDLAPGVHHLRFTRSGSFVVRLQNRKTYDVLVESVTIDTGGTETILPTPWLTEDLDYLRYDQSGDVVFIAMDRYTPYRIERRSAHSWSVVQYLPEDGPFRTLNTGPITLVPSNLFGRITLTASAPLFKPSHAQSGQSPGALFRIESLGQQVNAISSAAADTFTTSIRVTGVDNARIFSVFIDESVGGAATFTLQRSLESSSGPWTDITTYTADTVVTYDDGLDNVIAWYRLGVKAADFGSGSHYMQLAYSAGSIAGVVRVASYITPTQVYAEVLKPLGSIVTPSPDWYEGEWSTRRGWPSAVAFHESRLCWAGKGKLWLSATDGYDLFDQDIEGDSAPISRSIGSGPVDRINWLVSLERLIAGTEGSEESVRSSSLDEPLTPTAFQIKATSTQGSAPVDVITIDRQGVFVQAGGTRVYEMSMANDTNGTDFGVLDLTQLVPEIGEPRIVRAAAQRQPDTRIHFVRSDGTAAVLVFDRTENTLCWVTVTTGYPTQHQIEDVCVLPASGDDGPEDHVYYVVRRTLNGVPVRTIEKWASASDCLGGQLNKQADSFVTYDGAATFNITGLSHLNGEQVVVWADGADVGTVTSTGASWTQTYTVAGGQITLPVAVTKAVVGLPYKAQWQSSKLALATALGAALTKRKRVHGLGVVLADTHAQGLLFGRDFSHLESLPTVRNEAPVDLAAVLADVEDGALLFPGEWSTDSRICLEARAPRPCTTVAMVADTEVHEQR